MMDEFSVARSVVDMLLWHLCALDLDPNKRDKPARDRLSHAIDLWADKGGLALLQLVSFPEYRTGVSGEWRALAVNSRPI
jgi:hypothetical protein